MEAFVATALGCVVVELETGEAELVDDEPPVAGTADVSLPLLVASDQVGARIVAVVERRPPLIVSDDGAERGRRPAAAFRRAPRSRSTRTTPTCCSSRQSHASSSREDGGRFWRALDLELIGITAVAFS